MPLRVFIKALVSFRQAQTGKQAKPEDTPVHVHLDDFVPFVSWIRGYGKRYIKADLFAGLTVAVVAIPQSMAYALIAGLPVAIRNELNELNLGNKDLSRLRARLILLHGPDDVIIPYTESIALAAAVPEGQSSLFVIDGLAHVDIRPLGIDRRAMWRAIAALLAERDRR